MEKSGDEYFVVKVGKKRVWSYVTACVTCFNRGGRRIMIRARGTNIPNAVDVTNALRKSFYSNLQIEKVSLVEETIPGDENRTIVMAIEILLSKGT